MGSTKEAAGVKRKTTAQQDSAAATAKEKTKSDVATPAVKKEKVVYEMPGQTRPTPAEGEPFYTCTHTHS